MQTTHVTRRLPVFEIETAMDVWSRWGLKYGGLSATGAQSYICLRARMLPSRAPWSPGFLPKLKALELFLLLLHSL